MENKYNEYLQQAINCIGTGELEKAKVNGILAIAIALGMDKSTKKTTKKATKKESLKEVASKVKDNVEEQTVETVETSVDQTVEESVNQENVQETAPESIQQETDQSASEEQDLNTWTDENRATFANDLNRLNEYCECWTQDWIEQNAIPGFFEDATITGLENIVPANITAFVAYLDLINEQQQ